MENTEERTLPSNYFVMILCGMIVASTSLSLRIGSLHIACKYCWLLFYSVVLSVTILIH